MAKKVLSPEVKKFFAEIGHRNGKALFEKRGSEYFRNIAKMRKTHGKQKPKEETPIEKEELKGGDENAS